MVYNLVMTHLVLEVTCTLDSVLFIGQILAVASAQYCLGFYPTNLHVSKVGWRVLTIRRPDRQFQMHCAE